MTGNQISAADCSVHPLGAGWNETTYGPRPNPSTDPFMYAESDWK